MSRKKRPPPRGGFPMPTPTPKPEVTEEIKTEEDLEKAIRQEAANDEEFQSSNEVADAVKSAFTKFMDREQTKNLILKTISETNTLNKIELKVGETVTVLSDQPRHFLFPKILEIVNLNLAPALIGPAGGGKSTVMEQVAEALKLRYFLQNSVQGTHELTGFVDAHGRYVSTPFREAFQNGGLLLVDEADTSDAGALKWMNTALANGYAVFPDSMQPVKRHSDFRIAIAANTYGTGADRLYVGANQLDASTLDRFVFVDFNYDMKLEKILSGNIKWAEHVQKLRRGAEKEKARVVISPRATIHGAKLLGLNWRQTDVEDSVVWKGMDPELKQRIQKSAAAA
jgi:cobaltochelatase CobS